MHDFKYRAAAWSPLRDRSWPVDGFRSEYLHVVALTFLTNLARTACFALMPAQLAVLARNNQLWLDYIDIKLGRSLNPELKEYSPRKFSAEEDKLARPIVEKYYKLSASEK